MGGGGMWGWWGTHPADLRGRLLGGLEEVAGDEVDVLLRLHSQSLPTHTATMTARNTSCFQKLYSNVAQPAARW